MTGVTDRHVLLVHAHPDDESIGQGATMARYVAEGVGVTLVTCTAGEMGEILVPELEHLAADKDDTLGKMKVSTVLESLPGVGKVRAQKIMEELDISATRRIRGLGSKQRELLLTKFGKK